MIRRYGKADIDRLTPLFSKYWDSISDDSFAKGYARTQVKHLCNYSEVYLLGDNPSKSCLAFFPLNHISCQAHILLDGGDIKWKKETAISCVVWMLKNTRYKAIAAFIPERRKDVARFAALCGMRRNGKFERSFIKDGVVSDQLIYQCTDIDYFDWEKKQWQQQ